MGYPRIRCRMTYVNSSAPIATHRSVVAQINSGFQNVRRVPLILTIAGRHLHSLRRNRSHLRRNFAARSPIQSAGPRCGCYVSEAERCGGQGEVRVFLPLLGRSHLHFEHLGQFQLGRCFPSVAGSRYGVLAQAADVPGLSCAFFSGGFEMKLLIRTIHCSGSNRHAPNIRPLQRQPRTMASTAFSFVRGSVAVRSGKVPVLLFTANNNDGARHGAKAWTCFTCFSWRCRSNCRHCMLLLAGVNVTGILPFQR